MTAEDLTLSGTTTNTENVVSATDVTVADCLPPVHADDSEKKKKKKRSSSFSLLKAASMIFRTKQQNNEKQKKKFSDEDEDDSADPKVNQGKNNWKNIVGSMRPLTLQEKSPAVSPSPTVGDLQALIPQGLSSPAPSYMSSTGTMSRYASAVNLQELDVCDSEKEEDPDEVFDAITGDDMIDVKAEEFINQFYQQMRLQTAANQH